MSWLENKDARGQVYYYVPKTEYHRDKILALDLDGTLIQTESMARFPKDKDDWLFKHSLNRIEEYYKNGYKIVVLTNQSKILDKNAKIGLQDFKDRWVNIQQKGKIFNQAYLLLSPQKDFYRKPATGMWEFLVDKLNGNIKVNMSESIFVGDAAGRIGDFSDSDYKMALNLSPLKFLTPEAFFSGTKPVELPKPEFNPFEIFDPDTHMPSKDQIRLEKRCKKYHNLWRVIIMVGSPGSGKSSFIKDVDLGYNMTVVESLEDVNSNHNELYYLSQDKLKNKDKMTRIFKSILEERGNCIIDNTNPTKENRDHWSQIASDYGVEDVIFIYKEMPVQGALHLNYYRRQQGEGVPDVAIRTFFKRFQLVDKKTENCDDMFIISFVPKFTNLDHQKRIRQYLL